MLTDSRECNVKTS